jgi:hypothetical protein
MFDIFVNENIVILCEENRVENGSRMFSIQTPDTAEKAKD